MRLASIDIGSNTVLLLLVETDQKNSIVNEFNYYEMPRISSGLSTTNRNISSNKINDLLTILSNYKTLVDNYDCEKTFVVATNAMRIAENSDDIIEKVKDELNLNIKIISGEDEAKYSFLGASSVIENEKDKLVIDIGGGSTELIYGNNSKIKFKKSYPIGVVSLTEKYFTSERYNSHQILDAKKSLKETFDFINHIEIKTPTIAVAGTPTSLICMINGIKDYSNEFVEGNKIKHADLSKIISRLSKLNPVEIKSEFGNVVKGRNDVIFAGSLILGFISEQLKLDEIIVSSKGLRYGVILEFLNQNRL